MKAALFRKKDKNRELTKKYGMQFLTEAVEIVKKASFKSECENDRQHIQKLNKIIDLRRQMLIYWY